MPSDSTHYELHVGAKLYVLARAGTGGGQERTLPWVECPHVLREEPRGSNL